MTIQPSQRTTPPSSEHRKDEERDGLTALGEASASITANVGAVIDGKPEAIKVALAVLLAEGHLLIEDVPGVGKTMLAVALAKSVDCTSSRIQFTPDLLPSDVTGVSVFNQVERRFEFTPGAVFANIVIGDEINRASPKTQSALLECMEERNVTVDGVTHPLAAPFMVVATQNPIDMEGTYALPEAQRDRFMARIAMGYPDRASEVGMLDARDDVDPLAELPTIVTGSQLRQMIRTARRVFVANAVKEYAVDITRATREDAELSLGASPRATLQLVRAAKAWAALDARDHVVPDDIDDLLEPVLAHRLVPSTSVLSRPQDRAHVVSDVLERIRRTTPVPSPPALR